MQHQGARPTTIQDVADAAGVSVATVSRALRGLPNVAPSTRQRVRQTANELSYRADPSASALAAGRTSTIAMAVPLLDRWYFSQVISGAEAVVAQAGYDLLLFSIAGDESRQRLLTGPLIKRADGLILVDLRVPDDEAASLLDGRIQVVATGIKVPGASSVTVDNHQVAHGAVTHLIHFGHSKIALIEGAPDDPVRFDVPDERRAGYESALHQAAITPRPDYAVGGDFSVSGGRQAMAELLDLDDPPTAVFAMSDEMAFGALRTIWDRGLDSPADISIIGVDNHDLSHVIDLTTVHQDVAEHGAKAARLLLEHLANDTLPAQHHIAETVLIERGTAGPLPN